MHLCQMNMCIAECQEILILNSSEGLNILGRGRSCEGKGKKKESQSDMETPSNGFSIAELLSLRGERAWVDRK